MYAIIKTGGKQYKAAKDQTLIVEKIEGEPGATIELGEVLMLCGESGITVGTPTVPGAKVVAKIIRQARGKKVVGFTYKAKKNERKHYGHRQSQTHIQITDIEGGN